VTGFRRPAFGRKRLPPELVPAEHAFRQVLEVLEPAKEGLAEVLPTNRLPGRPLVDALGDFEQALEASRGLMAAWRRLEVEDVWQRCAGGLDLALERARRLRTEAPDLGGFEGLLGTIQSLLDPLDPFEEAAERFRHLRRRPTG
jgi:hypothetical protein